MQPTLPENFFEVVSNAATGSADGRSLLQLLTPSADSKRAIYLTSLGPTGPTEDPIRISPQGEASATEAYYDKSWLKWGDGSSSSLGTGAVLPT